MSYPKTTLKSNDQIAGQNLIVPKPKFTYRMKNYNTLQKIYHKNSSEQEFIETNQVGKIHQKVSITKTTLQNLQSVKKNQAMPVQNNSSHIIKLQQNEKKVQKVPAHKKIKKLDKQEPFNSKDIHCDTKKDLRLFHLKKQLPTLALRRSIKQSKRAIESQGDIFYQQQKLQQSYESHKYKASRYHRAKRQQISSRFHSYQHIQQNEKMKQQLFTRLFSCEYEQNMQNEDFQQYCSLFSKNRPHYFSSFEKETKGSVPTLRHHQLQIQRQQIKQQHSYVFEPELKPKFELNILHILQHDYSSSNMQGDYCLDDYLG